MVVCDLLAVDNPLRINRRFLHTICGEAVKNHVNKIGKHICHILGQITAVRSGIGDKLFFVKILRVIQGLLCRIAQHTVGITLQARQIVECRRLFRLFLALGLCDRCNLTVAG